MRLYALLVPLKTMPPYNGRYIPIFRNKAYHFRGPYYTLYRAYIGQHSPGIVVALVEQNQ